MVDNEVDAREWLAEWLRQTQSFVVDTANDSAEAVTCVQKAAGGYDVILMDIRLGPGPDGIATMKTIREQYPDIEVIIITGFGGIDDGVKAMSEGAYSYVVKPLNRDAIVVYIRSAAERRRLKATLAETISERAWLQSMLEISSAIQSTLHLDQVLKMIVDGIHRLGFDRVRLYLLENEALVGKVQRGDELPAFEGLRLDLGSEAYSRHTQETKKPTIYKHGQFGTDPYEEKLGKKDLEEWAEIPLLTKEEPVGKITVDNKYSERPISSRELELLMFFANQAAIAIENARLFDQLQEARDRLSSMVASSFDGIITADLKGTVREFNPQAEAILGYKAEEALGKHISELYHDPEEPRRIGELISSSPKGQLLDHGTHLRGKPVGDTTDRRGEKIPVLLSATWLYDSQGKKIGSVGFFRDLRRIQQVESQRELLLSTMQNVATAGSLEDGLDALAKNLVTGLLATFCYVILLDDTTQKVVAKAAYPIPRPNSKELNWNPGVGKSFDVSLVRYLLDLPGPTVFRRGVIIGSQDVVQHIRAVVHLEGQLESVLVIPLRAADQTLGLCTLGEMRSWERSPFTENTIQLARSMASQAAVLIGRMRSQEQSQRLLDQIGKAQDQAKVVAQLMVLGDRWATLASVAQGTMETVGCDAVTLYVYSQATGELDNLPTMAGVLNPERAMVFGEVLSDSLVYKMLTRDEPYIVEDSAQDALFKDRRFTRDERIKSCAAIPLKAVGQKVGVMFVNYRSQHRFTKDELANITLFANQAAIAIRNAQLYEQIERRSVHLGALYEAGKAITSSFGLDPKQILDRILEQAVERATGIEPPKVTLGYIELWDEVERTLQLVSVYPLTKWNAAKATLGAKRHLDPQAGRIGITGRAIIKGESQLVNDLRQDPDYLVNDSNTLSELDVLLRDGDKIIGVLSVESDQLNAFDNDDRRTLEALADLAVVVIKNAEQYAELKRTKGLVGARTAVAWMGMVSGAWRHSIDKHALTIREKIQLSRGELRRAFPRSPNVAKRLDDIERLASQILEKPITPPLSVEEGVRSVLLNDLIQERIKQLWSSEPYKSVPLQLLLELSESATVRASPEWLSRVLDVLVDNAVEAMSELSLQRLTIATRQSDHNAEILITDTGKGIPKDLAPTLFLVPVQKPKGTKGLGMGLLMAQTIVQTYGGEIRVGSTGSTGTTMIVSLPLEK